MAGYRCMCLCCRFPLKKERGETVLAGGTCNFLSRGRLGMERRCTEQLMILARRSGEPRRLLLRQKPTKRNIPSISCPLSSALLAPDRRYSETVPGVVGSQFNVVGFPAARESPAGGILKAFGAPGCAATSESSEAATGRMARRMAEVVELKLATGCSGRVTNYSMSGWILFPNKPLPNRPRAHRQENKKSVKTTVINDGQAEREKISTSDKRVQTQKRNPNSRRAKDKHFHPTNEKVEKGIPESQLISFQSDPSSPDLPLQSPNPGKLTASKRPVLRRTRRHS